ncbi:hypothetical protein FGB62_159g16 [Gracilaria domingensis]|nr:hypothetical protein FGB62_159g16 [Gracilaria domingensis]
MTVTGTWGANEFGGTCTLSRSVEARFGLKELQRLKRGVKEHCGEREHRLLAENIIDAVKKGAKLACEQTLKPKRFALLPAPTLFMFTVCSFSASVAESATGAGSLNYYADMVCDDEFAALREAIESPLG